MGAVLFPPLLLVLVAGSSAPVASMRDLAATLQGCFQPPQRIEGSQVTVRFRLSQQGALQGRPQIVASQSVISESDRRALDAAVLDALRRCTPVALAPSFGASLTGRVVTLRFIGGPRPQGI